MPVNTKKLKETRSTRKRRQSGSRAGSSSSYKRRSPGTEADDAFNAIRHGDVDAVVVPGTQGSRVFTLQGAERAYRILIESINEGALTLTVNKTILYANQRFAKMLKCPLEQVMGSSLRRFLSVEDRTALRSRMRKPRESGSQIQMLLKAVDGSRLPVQISIRQLPKNGSDGAVFGLVVTDMTEVRRTGELLRALTHRVVEAQEAERGRVALELHDNVTQLLCAVLFRFQLLAVRRPHDERRFRREAAKLHQMLGRTAEEVERISRDLRPGVLEQLGLIEVVRVASKEFAERTGVPVRLVCQQPAVRPPADTELAIYRIFQDALRNIEKHARAHHVTVRLRQHGSDARLEVKDDGVGFDPEHHSAGQKGTGLGLLSMRERASYVGGTVSIRSARLSGTAIEVRIPLPEVKSQ